jgi:hypothetical protein
VLKLYTQDEDTSTTDAGNRILLGFLTKAYAFEDPSKLLKESYIIIIVCPLGKSYRDISSIPSSISGLNIF